MSNKTIETIREKRLKINLKPKHEVIFQVAERLNNIDKEKYSPEYIEFLTQSSIDFIHGLNLCKSEDDITNFIDHMAKIANETTQLSRKATLMQLGSMALMADISIDYNDHEWKESSNSDFPNHLGIKSKNYCCVKCGSLGFIPHWDTSSKIFSSTNCLENRVNILLNS